MGKIVHGNKNQSHNSKNTLLLGDQFVPASFAYKIYRKPFINIASWNPI